MSSCIPPTRFPIPVFDSDVVAWHNPSDLAHCPTAIPPYNCRPFFVCLPYMSCLSLTFTISSCSRTVLIYWFELLLDTRTVCFFFVALFSSECLLPVFCNLPTGRLFLPKSNLTLGRKFSIWLQSSQNKFLMGLKLLSCCCRGFIGTFLFVSSNLGRFVTSDLLKQKMLTSDMAWWC